MSEAIQVLRDKGLHQAADILADVYMQREKTQWTPEELEKIKRHEAIVAMDKGSDMGDAMAMSFIGRTETPERVFLRDVEDELAKARAKFPYSGGSNTALAEEVGELAKALLDEHPHRIYREAVQVATMAARVALEGDPLLDQYRTIRQGVGASPARGLRP